MPEIKTKIDILKQNFLSFQLTIFLIFCWIAALPFRERLIFEPNSILKRVTLPDIIGVLLIVAFIFRYQKKDFQIPKVTHSFIVSAFVLLATFSLGIFVSTRMLNTTVELFAVIFLLAIYRICIEELNQEKFLEILIQLITIICLLISAYGLIDLCLSKFYVSKSTFRNRGQAGTYMMYICAILFSYIFSPLCQKHNQVRKNLMIGSLGLGIIFLISTLKFAAITGLGVGIFLFLVFKRKWKLLAAIGGVLMILYLFPELFPNRFYNILFYSFWTKIGLLKEGNFYYDHYASAINCFLEHPVLGSGLGGFHKVFHTHEVHSNYLKILATTGLVGTVGYLIFFYHISKFFIHKIPKTPDNPYLKVLENLFPFMIGCSVSWLYTYHLRNREFWLLMIFVSICYGLAIERSKKKLIHNSSTNAKR